MNFAIKIPNVFMKFNDTIITRMQKYLIKTMDMERNL